MEITDNAGDIVLPVLDRAKESLEIYSPFISPDYAEKLVDKAEKGIDIQVHTTGSDEDYHRQSLNILSNSGHDLELKTASKPAPIVAGAIVLGVLLFAGSLVPKMPSQMVLIGLVSIGFGICYWVFTNDGSEESEDRIGGIDVNIVQDLHAKVYIRDDGEEVAFGSCNFTKGGMIHNIEVVESFESSDSGETKSEKEQEGL